ncbi:CPBP family intramembrane metalloprotease [Waterburya agarophytonicola K14]|uniref:CPBP family intramembrane metalloprotease n=1 Tax=Waterburya agarophytonicola KI4 TaxID=2874699 RepID=A0A964FIK5_9CYAN|nr:CPBP family glutamic-type intramembrane protease [Waterburya agarophytonicola]MCC0178243.1 CPBP family intramembrane metalloprotease [Waterburya agarophytonicola KI4]
MNTFVEPIVAGFVTIPTKLDWLQGFFILSVYAIIALLFGLWTGFLQWNFNSSKLIIIRVAATSLVAPALLEELFFRALLLPYPSENTDLGFTYISSLVSLFLFVIYHPLNGLTFFPAGKQTFSNPVFLTFAAILGLACTIAYLSTGSIWISISIHWLAVVFWLLCLGGIDRLELSDN